jgi:hypothetical protein
MTRRGRIVLLAVVAVVIIGLGWFVVSSLRSVATSFAGPGAECTVTATPAAPESTITLSESSLAPATGTADAVLPAGTGLTVDAVQLQHAATINAVGLRLELPDRARVIALATALQESSLRNLPDGDRDSLGLFQQRPSQGWGTVTEIRDPVYAAGKFFDALLDVPGWADLALTDAAQEVQYSGFPDAYAKWEPAAERLATALSSPEIGTVNCRDGAVASTADTPQRPAPDGTAGAAPALATLLGEAQAELGGLGLTGLGDDGRSATVSVAVGGLDAAHSGAVFAAWAVAHTTGSPVTHIAVADRLWFEHAWGPADGTGLPAGQVRITVNA